MSRVNLVFLALAVASGAACFWYGGGDAVVAALADGGELLLMILPQLGAGLLIGGLVQQLVSRERTAALLGAQSGFKGLMVAAGAGMVTPGGPFTSFPLVYALWTSGADAGALISYIVAWALIGIHRLLIWELPFMGAEFSALRFAVSLPLPILAGLSARWLVAHTALRLKEPPSA
ncbi:permease [Acuticoccus sp. MNP-M23]|uniref:permease n=1 Tax=Acuticoccus sp. MNP-M23 TaxID=3072793 RepID=UPI0028168667|nr:permease [Acuticoccus sp. MNP-M23]WMS41676.1 permease [Acuticoccus sp. MNP-M23]